MAGAGYKLFTTGSVLTAAEVNTYLQEQVVMRFANSAARTSALSGVLAEGMVSYLDDTNVVEIYNGSAWASLDDPNAIQNTIVDAKGDLISASADNVPARLAVGNNGETLVADSSTSTGLRWQVNNGLNKIINGDLSIWQRGTTFTTVAPDSYTADRFIYRSGGGATNPTISRQAFTPADINAPSYGDAQFYLRCVLPASPNSTNNIAQRVEDVRTFAGQAVTFSFWAKASTNSSTILRLIQNFGSGGSSEVTGDTTVNVTTSWTRYSVTVTLGSVSGKTIGTSSYLETQWRVGNGANVTFETWGWQLEAGSVATAFQTATGTLQGELAACQRYYYRQSATDGANFYYYGLGSASSTTNGKIIVQFPSTMRVKPSAVDYSTVVLYDGAATTAVTAVTQSIPTTTNSTLDVTVASGLTQFRPYFLFTQNNAAGYVGFTAEL